MITDINHCKSVSPVSEMPVKSKLSQHAERHFLHRLESFRGLAALSVVIHHAFMYVRYEPSIGKYFRSIEAVFYGHGAVLSFFVLSGYVLGQSLRRQKTSNPRVYMAYVIKRCFRILPAFAVSIAFCYLLFRFFNLWRFPTNVSSSSYLNNYNFIPNASTFIKSLTLQNYHLNPVAWTLVPELICSFLLPILHAMSNSKTARCLLLFALAASWVVFRNSSHPLASAISFSWVFYVGYLIPLIHGNTWELFKRHSWLVPMIAIPAIVVCLLVPHFGHNEMIYTIAITIIIALMAGLPKHKLFSILDFPVARFVGKISYSLYLLHFPISYSLAGLMFYIFASDTIYKNSILFSILLAAGSVLMTLPFSIMLFTYIEKPFVDRGKKLARHVLHA